jgi:branched-subunit amino acid transport protein
MNVSIYKSLLIMIITIYMIRLLPLLFLRREITNKWLKSFLFYVPYVTLAVMTFPAILHASSSIWCGAAALAVGLLAAWFNGDLFVVAISCCLTVLVTSFIF